MVTIEEELEVDEENDDDAFRSAAVEGWQSDDVQIDPDAIVSQSDAGAFVAAWVWVSNSDAGIYPDEEKEERWQ